MNAAMAIGIAGAVATTATAGGAAAGTATGTVAATKWLGGFGLLKLVGATVVSGVVVVGVVHEERYLAAPAPPSSVHAAAATEPARPTLPVSPAPDLLPQLELTHPVELPTLPSPLSPPSPIPPPAPIAPRQTPHLAVPAGDEATPPEPRARARANLHGSLRDEVQQLDLARATLAEGRPAAALADLDAYDRAFPKGALSDEAELLRIETLAQAGDVDAARGRAERLLARDEHGPHARRVRTFLASLPRRGSAR